MQIHSVRDASLSATLWQMKKTIQYYTREVYGNRLEYVRDVPDAKIIQQLTGKKTITGVERELLRDLSGGAIQFERCFE